MITHIDISSVLRRTGCELYSNLVTRPTGVAVRTEIEQLLSVIGGRTLTVIDFSHVGVIDFSCADEIVAKLLLRYTDDAAPTEAYFLFRGLGDTHLDAIETVLEHHGLALVVELDGGTAAVVGLLGESERRVWAAVLAHGKAAAAELAEALGMSVADAVRVLDRLCRRRLVMRLDDEYVAVGGVVH